MQMGTMNPSGWCCVRRLQPVAATNSLMQLEQVLGKALFLNLTGEEAPICLLCPGDQPFIYIAMVENWAGRPLQSSPELPQGCSSSLSLHLDCYSKGLVMEIAK